MRLPSGLRLVLVAVIARRKIERVTIQGLDLREVKVLVADSVSVHDLGAVFVGASAAPTARVPDVHLAGLDLSERDEDDGTLRRHRVDHEREEDDDEDGAERQAKVARVPPHVAERVLQEEAKHLQASLVPVIIFLRTLDKVIWLRAVLAAGVSDRSLDRCLMEFLVCGMWLVS